MTVTTVLSFVVGLAALSAFFVAAIVMTILFMRETELPEAGHQPPGGLK